MNAYCCKASNLPVCFDLGCTTFTESTKSCPAEYSERSRSKGRSAGCDSAFSERIKCCLSGYDNRNSQNQNVNSDSEVITETKTVTLEDGTVKTVTKTRSKTSSGLFSHSESTFTPFVQTLLLLPILMAVL